MALTFLQQLDDDALDEYNRKASDCTWNELDASGKGFLPVNGSFMHLAKAARDLGYRPLVPLHSIDSEAVKIGKHTTKHPLISKWQLLAENPPSDADMRRWLQRNRNLGWGYVHDRALVVFDIDTPDKEHAVAMINWLFGNIPGRPPMMRMVEMPRVQLYYRAGPGCHQESTIEIFHSSGQTVLWAIHPDHKKPFQWRYGSPALRPLDDLPQCDGYHQLRFLQVWGGADGGGDKDAAYGKGNGKVGAFLKLARELHIPVPLQDPDDAARVVAAAPPRSRHNIAVGGACYMRWRMHATPEFIYRIIWPALHAALINGGDSNPRIIEKHHNDFKRAIGWVGRKVEEGE